MLSIEVTNHFECFYVGTETVGELKSFKQAIESFIQLIQYGYWDGAWALERYIDEELANDYDDRTEWDWGCGLRKKCIYLEQSDHQISYFIKTSYKKSRG